MIKLALRFLFDNPLGKVVAAGALAITVFVAFVHQQRNIGAAKAVVKVEKETRRAAKTLTDAAARSVDVSVRGKRDPSTRDD